MITMTTSAVLAGRTVEYLERVIEGIRNSPDDFTVVRLGMIAKGLEPLSDQVCNELGIEECYGYELWQMSINGDCYDEEWKAVSELEV